MAETTNSTTAAHEPPLAIEDEEDRFQVGERSGREIALCHVARAWIDRWCACGGDFGARFNADKSFGGIVRGMAEPSFWTPTDEGNEKLPPHTWLLEEGHQRGAVKVLEAMLILVPGLNETVRDIVGPSVWVRIAKRDSSSAADGACLPQDQEGEAAR